MANTTLALPPLLPCKRVPTTGEEFNSMREQRQPQISRFRGIWFDRDGLYRDSPDVLPELQGQRRAPAAACSGLQSRQLHANVGAAGRCCTLDADDAARKAREDRREGGPPRALRDVPTGRSRCAARAIRQHPAEDRAAPTEAGRAMSGKQADLRAATTGELRPAFRETGSGEALRGQEPPGTPNQPRSALTNRNTVATHERRTAGEPLPYYDWFSSDRRDAY